MTSLVAAFSSPELELLKHPFFLLLCTVLISGLLLPWFARWREDGRAELALKTELVSAMSECTMVLMVRIEAFVARAGGPEPPRKVNEQTREAHAAMNTAFHDFAVRSAVIGTKLEAYVQEGPLPLQWSAFRQVVTDFYACHGQAPDEFKKRLSRRVEELRDQLKLKGRTDDSWEQVVNQVLEIKAALIRKVLAESFRLQIRR